jgi:glycosyltransferase involved in cell wall biosynthesis
MTISVVIPVFNRPLLASRAIESALAQEQDDLDVIVVDDGSTPPYALPVHLAADPRVRLVRTENSGAAAARNRGIAEARSAWIAFLDSDDVFLPGKLAAQVALADATDPLAVIVSGFRYVWPGSARTVVRMPVEAAAVEDFAGGCWFCPGSTALVHVSAFARIGPFDAALRRLEDLDWFLRLAKADGRIKVAPVIGADITIGANATIAAVDAAAEAIAAKHLRHGSGSALPDRAIRRLRAFLALEQAVVRFRSRAFVAALPRCAASWLILPRFSVQTRSWWR